MVPDPLPLHKTHVLMNKFYGPEDSDYATVASKIEEFLQKIRKKEADDWIRDKTYTPEKIKIERLSGDLLPMDKCYINLAIVERLGQGIDREEEEAEEEGPTASPFSLLARQKLQAPRKSMQVELATVFSDRRGSDGRTMQPRRILIRGRAGVGKTTLCKKIVHEFYRGTWSEWTRIFDRILWVPLRNLKLEERRLVAGYSFEHLLEHEFFAIPNRRLDLVKELSDILARESSKTLFLLDGLDEISGDLGGSDDMSRFLKELLKQPNVIITSRPSANPPPDMDLELETIGFYPEQVRDYLGADPEMGPKAEEVMRFLEKHWLIGSLVRIPIQLDAFCCAWDDLNSEPVPSTMTGIYTAITQSLLKKDSVRLSRTPEGELTSQLHPFEIEKKLEPEIILLEYLAFNGLHCDIIEFTRSHLRKIGPRAPPLSSSSLDGTLSRLSFLRVSDHSSKRHNPSYHFLHLTFQEYFAARYFARKWTSGQFLDCFNFQSGQNESIEAKAFLQGEKYNARYDILWRFVTGLLAAQKPEYLRDFVDVIEDEPRDLFGPAHERLLMHCLNEMALSKNNDSLKKLRQTIERRCHEWSIYEYERCGRMHLCRESEFPDRVVSDMLSDASSVPDVMSFFLDALGSRPQLQKSILEELVGVLKDSHETKVRGSAIRVLVRQSPLPDNILQALALLLEHTDPEISYSASTVLQEHPSMSESILQALKLLLEHTDYKVRYSAARILLKQSSLPDNIIQALILQVEHTDSEVRNSAYSALERQCSLPENIIQALFLQLEHIDAKVRHSTTRVLRKQSSLPENIIQALVLRLDHTDSEVRKSAYSTLEGQSSLPHNIIQDLFLRLEHTDSTVRHSITRVLQEQSSLPHNIIQFFASRLQDANEDVRVCTIEVLGGHPLSDNIINALISQLEDANDRVRVSAIEALGKQPLSDNIINALASRLLDTEDYIRASAIEVLGKQSSSDNIINALASRLQDASDYVRASAVEALGKQPLSANIINALASRLQDAENYVRVSAIEALGKQPLTDNIINALASQLQDTEDYVRVSATRVLWKQSSLPDHIIEVLVSQLDDPSRAVRERAAKALDKDRVFSVLLTLHIHTLRALYRGWLDWSFTEHFSCYMQNGSLCFETAQGRRKIALEGKEDFVKMFLSMASEMGRPGFR